VRAEREYPICNCDLIRIQRHSPPKRHDRNLITISPAINKVVRTHWLAD